MIKPAICLFVCAALSSAHAADSQNSEYNSYTLSMAGALINNHCEQTWQASEYISLHACNYQLAQLYNLEQSSTHFAGCATESGGDIVKIADCMLTRFDEWAAKQIEL